MKHVLTIAFLMAGFAAGETQNEAKARAAAEAVERCKSAGVRCTVSYAVVDNGDVWVNGVPINRTVTTVTQSYVPPKPKRPVVVYPPAVYPIYRGGIVR